MEKSVVATAMAEYSCVSRLRRRRRISYLSAQGHPNAYAALFGEMDEFFNVGHLQRLVMGAKWDDAIGYLLRFLPNHPDPMSVHAKVLFAKILAGKRDDDTHRLANKYRYYRRLEHLSHGEVKLRCVILAVLHCDTLRHKQASNGRVNHS